MRRVVVTGLGAVTPVGSTARETWDSAVAGRSGIDFIRSFDASGYPRAHRRRGQGLRPGVRRPRRRRRGGWTGTCCSRWRPRRRLSRMRRSTGVYDPMRVGILFGSAIGGIIGIMEQGDVLRDRGGDRVSPYFIPERARRRRLGPDRHLARLPRAELRPRVGVRDRLDGGRGGGGADPSRRRRRRARGRRRGVLCTR